MGKYSLPNNVMDKSLEEQIKYVFGLVRASGGTDDVLADVVIGLLKRPPPAVQDFSALGYQKSGGTP